MRFPSVIESGFWKEGHVQGVAVDQQKGYVYFSFTTILLKTDLHGNPIGSVEKLAGHLGCITFDPDRRRIYGSLELKHDEIGKDIIDRIGWDPHGEDNFYLVSFDVDKIDKMGMNAESDGVMKAVWLSEVAHDYAGTDPTSGCKHIYGCSGIDGTGYGPAFGTDEPKKIMVAYGIYSQTDRTDNDHQVILQLEPEWVEQYGQPLFQENPHHSGPEKAEQKYFVYTGNTRYGIQNLEYDASSRLWLAAVYRGEKEAFGNYPLYLIDGAVLPREEWLTGRAEPGLVLALAPVGQQDRKGVWGIEHPYGATGICALDDGRIYFSKSEQNEATHTFASRMLLYRFQNNSFFME